jgi:hypothetical protein
LSVDRVAGFDPCVRRHRALRAAPEKVTTITLKRVFCGTELNLGQKGLPTAIPPEACCLGWQESLTLLAKLVEAEIPD